MLGELLEEFQYLEEHWHTVHLHCCFSLGRDGNSCLGTGPCLGMGAFPCDGNLGTGLCLGTGIFPLGWEFLSWDRTMSWDALMASLLAFGHSSMKPRLLTEIYSHLNMSLARSAAKAIMGRVY